MKSINIEGDTKNPKVYVSPEEGLILLQGRSIVPNPVDFYEPILNWIDEYTETLPFPLTLDFKLEYFNTASHKMILQMFLQLKDSKEKGANITINWHHYDYDEDLVEIGEEIELLTGMEFNYREIST